MTAFVALLRAVNVGGHAPVAMADLRRWCGALGFADVQSVLQTGNLVFRARARSGPALERRLATAAASQLGLDTECFVRTAAEWRAIVARNPFPKEAARDPGHLLVVFLKNVPRAARVTALQTAIAGPERVAAAGHQLYAVYPNGMGRSRVTLPLIERTLGTRGTGRNWNTVLKLGVLVGASSGAE